MEKLTAICEESALGQNDGSFGFFEFIRNFKATIFDIYIVICNSYYLIEWNNAGSSGEIYILKNWLYSYSIAKSSFSFL